MMQKSAGGQDRDLLRWHWLSDTHADGLLIAANDRRDSQEPSLYNYLNWLQRKKDAAELRRLIYVGVTRARNSVCISAGHHPDKDWPVWPSTNTGLGVLREAVEEEVIFHPALEPSPGNEEDGDDVTGFYRLPLDCMLAINESAKDEKEYLALARGSSAAYEDERGGRQLDRDVLYQASNQVERLVGISCHRILEILSKRQVLPDAVDSNILGAIDLSLRSSGLEKQSFETAREQVVAMINKTLTDDKGRWILKCRPDSSSEMGIDILTEEGLQSRILDRVFCDEGTGITWVVDYKTSRRPEGESVEDFLERESNHYREQVATYVDLVARLDEGAVDIRGALYFPAESLWRPIV
jgi:ATP-dependent exoDNAse (exonuclease V) beta subunit